MIDDRVLDVIQAKQEPGVSLRFATVTQATPLRIRLDGDTSPLPYTPKTIGAQTLSSGNRVACLTCSSTILVMGRIH